MYIAKLAITNLRCFRQTTVEFQPGINVVLGENNAGKTALLCALRLVFDRSGRLRPDLPDFYQGIADFTKAPTISVTATLRSSTADTLDDKALVATWLTKLDAPWEAQLTYEFFLPDEEVPAFTTACGATPEHDQFFRVLEQFIPKYVARIFAGLPENRLVVEPDALAKFDCHTVAAIRDVESELFAGTNPLLRTMLRQVLDHDADEAEALERRRHFRTLTQDARSNLTSRMNLEALFQLAKGTGAADGGTPILRDAIDEDDFIAALRLYIDRAPFTVPATHNGLGYNNLVYISLLLASLQFKASVPRRGQNAILFPMLLIEEPEAHLHPSLQYKLLRYIQKRLSTEKTSRQVFLTTHSTQITAAAGLEPIICLSLSEADGGVHVAYPARVFGESPGGKASRNYVERYLDATKSNMLFAKGVIFVEGIAEQLLVPCLSQCIGRPIETHHVAVIAVGGVTFKHFLPLFGAGEDETLRRYALRRRVACMVDADPARKDKSKDARRQKCWPYALHCDCATYDYFPVSGVVTNLQTMRDRSPGNIEICVGIKTLEYDLALANAQLSLLVTASCEHEADLRALAEAPATVPATLQSMLARDGSDTLDVLAACPDVATHRFATCYMLCAEDAKGEHALVLERQLRENASKPEPDRRPFVCPDYIKKAILWTCVFETQEAPHV
ncbi:MAG TPA: AAA family ATPase [Sedimentisphaerales bacterium]|nr:AAA family ATPase [Sedimentisphaerales bacterium]